MNLYKSAHNIKVGGINIVCKIIYGKKTGCDCVIIQPRCCETPKLVDLYAISVA